MADETTTTQDNTTAVQGTEASDNQQTSTPQAQEPVAPATAAPLVDSAKHAEEPKEKAEDNGLLGKVEESKEPVVPEKYEDFKLPEGVKLDDELKEDVSAIAKDLKLTQEEADKSAAAIAKFVESARESLAKEIEQARNADAELWNKQPDAAERTLLAQKAVTKLGIKEQLAERGHLYDATVMHILAEYGKVISEAHSLVGKTETPQTKQRMYPNTPSLYENQ